MNNQEDNHDMLTSPQKPEPAHHLLRVRIHKRNFNRLKEMAKAESEKFGEYISVSDLVRGSIINLIQVENTKQRLEVVVNPKRKPKLRKG